jgi:hypothetical protein
LEENVGKNQETQLARAIARGGSITAWAQRYRVPLSTAFRWAQDPKVRREVEAWRRRALNPGAPGLASLSLNAADGITKLAQGAESESVQLTARRAIRVVWLRPPT